MTALDDIMKRCRLALRILVGGKFYLHTAGFNEHTVVLGASQESAFRKLIREDHRTVVEDYGEDISFEDYFQKRWKSMDMEIFQEVYVHDGE